MSKAADRILAARTRQAENMAKVDPLLDRERLAADLRFFPVPLGQIVPNPRNPRKEFKGIAELAEDIKVRGILIPLLVRRAGENRYEIIAGERRYRAAQLAGFTKVPVLLTDATDSQSAEYALVENLSRNDLSFVEICDGFSSLEGLGVSRQDLAKQFGRSESTIKKYLAISPLLTAGVRQEILSSGFADYASLATLGSKRLDEEATVLLVRHHEALPTVFCRQTLSNCQDAHEVKEAIKEYLSNKGIDAKASNSPKKQVYERQAVGRLNFAGGDLRVSFTVDKFSLELHEEDPRKRKELIRRAISLLEEAEKRPPEKWRSHLTELRNKERAQAAAEKKSSKEKPRK